MNSKGQGKGAVIGLLAVILIAGYFIVRQASPTRYRAREVDWACEQCDHIFTARAQWGTLDCPSCPGEAVRTHIYYDTANDELIEVYREKPHPEADMERMGEEDILYKVPGGQWRPTQVDPGDYYGFPVRVERPQDLIYAPPGSEYR